MAKIADSIVEGMTRSEELAKQIRDKDDHIKRLQTEVREYIRAEEVMIAAGLISKEKVEQAHEIVRDLK